MTLDPSTIDPTTLPASPELDVLVAEWMGWQRVETIPDLLHDNQYQVCAVTGAISRSGHRSWSPSTNAAHAGEARRKADKWEMWFGYANTGMGIVCRVWRNGHSGIGRSNHSKINGMGQAEALATVRAIAGVARAVETAKGGG